MRHACVWLPVARVIVFLICYHCAVQQALVPPAEGITHSIYVCNLGISSDRAIFLYQEIDRNPLAQVEFIVHVVCLKDINGTVSERAIEMHQCCRACPQLLVGRSTCSVLSWQGSLRIKQGQVLSIEIPSCEESQGDLLPPGREPRALLLLKRKAQLHQERMRLFLVRKDSLSVIFCEQSYCSKRKLKCSFLART